MKNKLCLLVMCMPLLMMAPSFVSAQDDKGIKWTTGLSWEQVKQKAKAENKYIFLDCFTTWCGPCKMMDKNIYANDTVGSFLNGHFIAVKVQMDKTEKDDQIIKDWYTDAAAIEKEYVVNAYPSLIFFSPEGKILQKEVGYKPVEKFVSIAEEALTPGKAYDDPYKEYKALVKEYKQGVKHYDRMPYMIKTAGKLNDTAIARQLFREHLEYASGLDEMERYTKENIDLWGSIILKLDSKALVFFLKDGDKIDHVMNQKGFAMDIVDRTIQARIVDSFFKKQKGETTIISGKRVANSEIMFIRVPLRVDGKIEPDYVEADWKDLERMIKKKFNKDYVKRNVFNARKRWYQQHQNILGASEMYFSQLDSYPPSNFEQGRMQSINGFAWQTFLYANDKKLLKTAAKWMAKMVQNKPDEHVILDTYANLLYKLGRITEAIQWEEKAFNVTNSKDEAKRQTYRNVIEKMKNGDPTYLEQGAKWEN